MPKLQVSKQSPYNPKDTFEKVTRFLENDADLKKLDPSYKCQFDPAALKGTAKGKMFSAQIAVTAAGAGANVDIQLDLPLAFALAKGLVQKTLQKKLDQSLA